MPDFTAFPLPEGLHQRLAHMQYETPTDIQQQAIPLILEGHDILGSAQTGTGKTGAFLIPIIAKLMENPTASAIIMAPTRELAQQVHAVGTVMIPRGKSGGIHTALLIGGEQMGKQFAQLRRHPRIIIGTPGRITDHLNRGTLVLDTIEIVVLDETDRMLDMGFGVQIDAILEHIKKPHQTLLFSATLPKAIVKLAKTYLKEPKRIAAGELNAVAKNITQTMKETKNKMADLLHELRQREGTIIVFVKTQHSADMLSERLNDEDQHAMAIHGGLKQNKKDMVIRKLRSGHYRILVATDVAARGLDIPHIAHVINYDLPLKPEDYIHRIGRTARGENTKGEAISLVGPMEKREWKRIQDFLKGDEEEGYDPYNTQKPKRTEGRSFQRKPFERRQEAGDRRPNAFHAHKPKRYGQEAENTSAQPYTHADRPRRHAQDSGNTSAQPYAYAHKPRRQGQDSGNTSAQPYAHAHKPRRQGQDSGNTSAQPYAHTHKPRRQGDTEHRKESTGENRSWSGRDTTKPRRTFVPKGRSPQKKVV